MSKFVDDLKKDIEGMLSISFNGRPGEIRTPITESFFIVFLTGFEPILKI